MNQATCRLFSLRMVIILIEVPESRQFCFSPVFLLFLLLEDVIAAKLVEILVVEMVKIQLIVT